MNFEHDSLWQNRKWGGGGVAIDMGVFISKVVNNEIYWNLPRDDFEGLVHQWWLKIEATVW